MNKKTEYIIKCLKHGLYVVESKDNKIQIFSPIKDWAGDYRSSGRHDSLEKAKQYIGFDCGYSSEYFSKYSKNWKILTPFYLEAEERFEVGDKVVILETVEETDGWKYYKEYYPDMKGEIVKTDCGTEAGFHYEVKGKDGYTFWLNEKYLAPAPDFEEEEEEEDILIKNGKKYRVKIMGEIKE